MEYLGYVIGAGGVLFSGITLGYNLFRNRRLDVRADGDRETSVAVALARVDERLKALEADAQHCIRAEYLTPHLAALEARVSARIESEIAAALSRGERRRE